MGVAGPILWELVPSVTGGIVLSQDLQNSLSTGGQGFWPSGGPLLVKQAEVSTPTLPPPPEEGDWRNSLDLAVKTQSQK